ncbi:hypothetical protein RBB77_06720 [Tunturibacter psychrotolerans]|uniref:Uncharacterized protein n=1 Tax=Tunturiibacter psychrotolerans TaxID=3069686 RepID=A0AAU7ZU60_9BACT
MSVRSGAQVFLSGLTIANGNANSGGGILNSGTLTVTSSAFTSNSTPGNLGGAIENSGTLTVANSTFSGNSSGNEGGAGGELYKTETLMVSNSTFVGNSSANGGGVGVFDGTATIANSIFAHNTSASAGAAVLTPEFVVDAYNNLFFANIDSGNGSESDCFNCTINSGSISVDPMLAALGNYGGTTQTNAAATRERGDLRGAEISAVDASGNPLTADQRGFTLGVSSSTYCSVTTVDAGAVQTDYTSIQFTNIPGGGAYSAIQNAAANRLPIISGEQPGRRQCACDADGRFAHEHRAGSRNDGRQHGRHPSTLTLRPTTVPSPTADVAYSQTLSASGGSGTYTYASTSGSLPTGFMLSRSGVIGGISTTTNPSAV